MGDLVAQPAIPALSREDSNMLRLEALHDHREEDMSWEDEDLDDDE